MAKVDGEPGILEFLFRPKFLDITTRPAQESTSIADSHKATIELAARMTACLFGSSSGCIGSRK